MRKYFLVIVACVLNVLVSCRFKGEGEEDDLYNPYDTSELLDTFNFSGDTVYTMDSVAKGFKLHKIERK